jgi:acyl carrier protein
MSDTGTDTTADAILAQLQKAYDVVKIDNPRTLTRDDRLVADLQLDSLDVIDVVSVLEDDLPPDVIDAVIDQSSDIETVGQLVDSFVAAS